MSFTEQQPKDGECVLHCGHLKRWHDRSWHWFQYATPMKFQRPDGTKGEADWFIACEPCFHKHGEGVTKFARGDAQWNGDEPVITASEKS